MRYLIFMDDLRRNAVWIALVLVAILAGLLIRAPWMVRGWKRTAVRTVGALFLSFAVIVAIPAAFFARKDPPAQHFVFRSADGSRVALLSRSETRDSAAAEVTVKGNRCCSRYVAYRYFGDGDDYTGPDSLQWVDDHHLIIRFARDETSTTQDCRSQIGDITVVCVSRPDPHPLGR